MSESRVNVVKFSTFEKMLTELCQKIRKEYGISIGIKDAELAYDKKYVIVVFEIKNKKIDFKIWKNVDGPSNNEWRLHITPPYHPAMKGKKRLNLISGDTNAYICASEDIIRSVYSPEEARVNTGLFSSWEYLKHPFYAKGKTLGVEISLALCMDKDGYQTLCDFFEAALNQGNTYIAVSGGFNPPYDLPENVLREQGIQSSTRKQDWGRYIRGSEHDCVWEHKILGAERKRKGSLIPDWFYKEGWLKIYRNETPSFD